MTRFLYVTLPSCTVALGELTQFTHSCTARAARGESNFRESSDGGGTKTRPKLKVTVVVAVAVVVSLSRRRRRWRRYGLSIPTSVGVNLKMMMTATPMMMMMARKGRKRNTEWCIEVHERGRECDSSSSVMLPCIERPTTLYSELRDFDHLKL